MTREQAIKKIHRYALSGDFKNCLLVFQKGLITQREYMQILSDARKSKIEEPEIKRALGHGMINQGKK